MLALEVSLLTGRYVATSFDDRTRAEWPPHPARLFSALVAAHAETEAVSTGERRALEWLETLGPPTITASDAAHREVVTVFVPVNDGGVVPDVDDEACALDQAQMELDAATDTKSRSTAQKKVVKARARMAEAVRRAMAEVPRGKESKDGPARARALLPEHRGRQPRTFPSVAPEDPRVVFAWPRAEVSKDTLELLDALASRVARLGHSSSLVCVRASDDLAVDPTWIPDETGEVRRPADEAVLRVVAPGQIAALDRTFELHGSETGRVMPATFQRYVRPTRADKARAPTTAFGQDWIILRRVSGPRLPSVRAVDVARGVRSALLKSYGQDAPEILSGHRSPGEPSARPHLAIVPLPFTGHPRADGTILGVAVVLPFEATRDERRAVLEALRLWQDSARRDDDDLVVPLNLGRAGQMLLSVLEEEAEQSTLVARTWCRRSSRWATATPIALDRNPGNLRSTDPDVESAAYEEAERTIATACEHIGLPRPSVVVATPAAPLAGGDKARQFPPYVSGKVQRVLVHATLSFDVPVEGPLLLGAGRYLGLGLLRPVVDHA